VVLPKIKEQAEEEEKKEKKEIQYLRRKFPEFK